MKCYSLDFLKICFGWGIGQEVFKEVELRASAVTNPKHKASTIQTLSTLHPNSTKFVVLQGGGPKVGEVIRSGGVTRLFI